MSTSPSSVGGGRLGRRAAWTFAGQALSSSSNFVVTLWALATLPAAQFALFAVCMTTFLLLTQLSRAVVSTPVLVLYAGSPTGADRAGARAALGAGTLFGIAAGTAVAAGALLAAGAGRAGGEAVAALLVLAAALPALEYQDVLRHALIAHGRPQWAAASDAGWLVMQLGAFAAVHAAGRSSAATVLAAWAGAGTVAGLAAGAAQKRAPHLGAAMAWWRSHRPMCRRLLGEFAASAGSYYVVAYGLAMVAGAAELGRLRAAQALFGPASVLLLGGSVLGVPESVRAAGDERALRRLATGLSAGLAGAAVASGAALVAALGWFGPGRLPAGWLEAWSLVPALTAFGAGIGASAGALSGLRALGDGAWIVRAQAGRAAAAVAGGLAASAAFGAPGALAGLAVAEWLFAVVLWTRFLDRLRPRRAEEPPVAIARIDPVRAATGGAA